MGVASARIAMINGDFSWPVKVLLPAGHKPTPAMGSPGSVLAVQRKRVLTAPKVEDSVPTT